MRISTTLGALAVVIATLGSTHHVKAEMIAEKRYIDFQAGGDDAQRRKLYRQAVDNNLANNSVIFYPSVTNSNYRDPWGNVQVDVQYYAWADGSWLNMEVKVWFFANGGYEALHYAEGHQFLRSSANNGSAPSDPYADDSLVITLQNLGYSVKQQDMALRTTSLIWNEQVFMNAAAEASTLAQYNMAPWLLPASTRREKCKEVCRWAAATASLAAGFGTAAVCTIVTRGNNLGACGSAGTAAAGGTGVAVSNKCLEKCDLIPEPVAPTK